MFEKVAHMKKVFLDESMKWELRTATSDGAIKTNEKTNMGSVCQKCTNLDGKNTTCLDLSVFHQFSKFATFEDVIEARKKRQITKELEKQLLVDQNVQAPDIRFLLENKMNECPDE